MPEDNYKTAIAERTENKQANAANSDKHKILGEKQAARSHEEVQHKSTLFAEPVFHVGNFTVTNALINSWIVVFLIILLSVLIRKKLKKIPGIFQNFVEIIIEGALELVDSVTGDRKKTLRFFPLTFGLFIFILLNNWLGFFPGAGSIGFVEEHSGHAVFVPLFRGGTADLNTTLALAILAIIATHIFGIITVGSWKYLNKFINLKGLAQIPGKIIKDPTVILVNPIKFFVGIVELVGEFAKVASLSFRLFGNIFAGEVLLASMAVIFAFLLPIPFMFLEIIVGIIQALIFAMLTLVFLVVAATDEEH